MQRYNLINIIPRYIGYILILVVFSVLTTLHLDIINSEEKRSLLGLGLGSFFCIALFLLQTKNIPLAKIGYFSYSIYLFHVFFTAGTRIAFEKLGMINTDILFILSLTAGLTRPILIELIGNRNNVARAALLGKKAINT